MSNKSLLIIAGILLLVGLTKLDLSNIMPSRPVSVDLLELSPPKDEVLRKEADDVVSVLKDANAKADALRLKRLRDLYVDLAKLTKLDDADQVIKNTEEIRQANSIAGVMLDLDLKNKYKKLSKEANDVLVVSIGDDSIMLSKELRVKGADGFEALAWAINEAIK